MEPNRIISDILEKANYSPSSLEEALEVAPEITINQLTRPTRKGDVDFNTEQGRNAWRSLYEYFEKRGMTEEMRYNLDKNLFISTASDLKSGLVAATVDTVGFWIAVLTLNWDNSYSVVKRMYQKAGEKHRKKMFGAYTPNLEAAVN